MEMVINNVALRDTPVFGPLLERHLLHDIDLFIRQPIGFSVKSQVGDLIFLGNSLEFGVNMGACHIRIDFTFVIVAPHTAMFYNFRQAADLLFEIEHITVSVCADGMIADIQGITIKKAVFDDRLDVRLRIGNIGILLG